MRRESTDDLIAFLTVAREASFTRAAAKLGISQPALSATIRNLEERLGIRLLTRTTRSVAPTDAGERLIESIGPHFDGIEAGLAALTALSDKPSGNLRLTSVEHASDTILAPALAKLLLQYPDIKVEISNDYGLSDIVTERFDAGVRLGKQVDKDMIAVRIGPDFEMVVVGSPSYFIENGIPETPHDLVKHLCIALRLPSSGGLWSWPFAKDGRELKVRPNGELVFNTITLARTMALAGIGLAYLPEDLVQDDLNSKRLVRCLADWMPLSSGYHLYYPSRRQPVPAFTLLVDALRYRPKNTATRKNKILFP